MNVSNDNANDRPLRRGAVVVCGGHSTRMGRAKAMLPFGDETMLGRVVRLLGEVVEPIVVVAAADQPLPPLPPMVDVARDRCPDRGPLEGMAVGLARLADRADAAFVTGCDVPLLVPAAVTLLFDSLGDHQIVVPQEGKFYHPLAAVYRTDVRAAIESLLAADRLRPAFLFDEVDTLRLPVDQLRRADPQLQTLRNLNRPEDYEAALRNAST